MSGFLSSLTDTKSFSSVLVVLTVGVEEFASFVVFECPCNRNLNRLYGLTYLFAPAVILFFIALVNQKMFWRLITGSCKRKVSAFGGEYTHARCLLSKMKMTKVLKNTCKSQRGALERIQASSKIIPSCSGLADNSNAQR